MKVTTRQGTAVIRLAEAHARVRLSPDVSATDAERAVAIFDMAFRNVATDPVTGKLDISRIDHKPKWGLVDNIIKFIRGSGSATEASVISGMQSHGYDIDKITKTIRQLKNEGKIIEPKEGLYRVM